MGRSVTLSGIGGLSPRVRGNPSSTPIPARATWSIPARAGEPSFWRAPSISCRVYPRACGGTVGLIVGLFAVQGRRCNARPSRADLDPSCVLEPEALGARNLPWPAPRPSAPLPRRVRVPLEPPPPHRNGFRHPARHRHAPATRRLPRHRRTTRLIPAGRAPATARPPIRLNRGRIPALQPA